MEKNEQMQSFKKEFLDEIKAENVSIESLKKYKISNAVLSAEVKLRKVFGDEIYVPEKKEETLNGKKEIVKLSETDIAFDSEVREICENLDNSDFDSKVLHILSKSDV